jgi:hypothetical protein
LAHTLPISMYFIREPSVLPQTHRSVIDMPKIYKLDMKE